MKKDIDDFVYCLNWRLNFSMPLQLEIIRNVSGTKVKLAHDIERILNNSPMHMLLKMLCDVFAYLALSSALGLPSQGSLYK